MKSRLLASLLLTACALFAADPAPAPAAAAATPTVDPAAARMAARQKLADGLTYRQGETIIGDKLKARTIKRQKTEIKIGCKILNIMTLAGMPKSIRVKVLPIRTRAA